MNAEKYFFELPATSGIQGGITQYMLSVPMTVLKRLLAIDNQGDVMTRSQREANKSRAKKISNYISCATNNKTPYILPSLTGNVDTDVEFIKSELSPKVGILRIPLEADLKLFDGQHRAIGIMDFARDYSNTFDTISLLLTVGLPLEMRQQFFSDINNNATKPAAAISMAYNNNDPVNQLAMYLAKNLPGLKDSVDFEHNAVPSKSDKLISFKALNDATKKMLGLRNNSEPTPQQRDEAVKLWSAWSSAMHWQDISQDEIAPEYRSESLGIHGVMVNAMGLATANMLQTHNSDEIVNLLSCAESGDRNFHYRETFLYENWKGICVDNEKGTIKTDRRALEAAAKELQRIIDPFAECAWLRPYLGDDASDAMMMKFSQYIEKFKSDSNIPQITIVKKLELIRDGDQDERIKTVSTMRSFSKYISSDI